MDATPSLAPLVRFALAAALGVALASCASSEANKVASLSASPAGGAGQGDGGAAQAWGGGAGEQAATCGPCPEPPPCWRNECEGGECALRAAPAGSACDDGERCTGGDRCDGAGVCLSGSSPEFVSLFGEDQAAQFWGVVALDDGGALAVGSTAWGEASSYDVSIVVADLDGKLVAEHRWGEEGNETARAVARAAAGGFAVVGSATDGQGAGDGILLGLSPTGEVLWQQRYEGGGSDSFSAVAALGDGGYALAGIAKAAGATSQAWVVRTDAAGKALWQALLAGQKSEAVTAVIEAAGGGVVVAGHRRDISIERYDAWLEWLDGSGASLGRRVYVEQSLLSVSGLVATQDGGAALLLDVYEGGAKAVVIRVNAAGDELWRATVPLPGGADAPSVVLAEPGGTYRVVSTIFGSPSPGRVLVFSRLGAEGQLLGQVEVNPHERVGYRANAAARLASGAFLLAGGSWVAQSSAASSAARAALLRLDPDGAAGCEPRLGCLGKPFAACDDGDPCTIETCDGAKGCLHGPDATKACSPAGG